MAADITSDITTGTLAPPVLNAVVATTPVFPTAFGESYDVRQTELAQTGGGGSTRPSTGRLYPRTV